MHGQPCANIRSVVTFDCPDVRPGLFDFAPFGVEIFHNIAAPASRALTLASQSIDSAADIQMLLVGKRTVSYRFNGNNGHNKKSGLSVVV